MLENFSQDPNHPALQRFADGLPKWLRCTNDFAHGLARRDRKQALEHKYIELYEPRRTHLVLDVDRKNAILTAIQHGLPTPTFTVVNPTNTYAHLFYELETPVSFGKRSRQHPQDYFHAVRAAYNTKAEADPQFVHLIAKNPLHSDWECYATDNQYSLAELAEYAQLTRHAKVETNPQGKNCTVFDTVRHWGYASIHKPQYAIQRNWEQAVWEQCDKTNQTYSNPLPDSEVKHTARSIAKWIWRHKNRIGVRVMGFAPIAKHLSDAERQEEEIRREIAGSRYVGDRTQKDTDRRIAAALKPLSGQTVHTSYIRHHLEKVGGFSVRTIAARYPLAMGMVTVSQE